ncbi:MAG: protein-disulfide reductase DsbD N-terminal domain-containing protein, partial [Pseudomonadota bacterium]
MAAYLLMMLGSQVAAAAEDFLPPEMAFKVGAVATAPDRVEVIFQVHPGYYLYRSRMKFEVEEGQPVALGTPDLPKGKVKTDEFFGEQEVYLQDVVARIPVSRGSGAAFTLPLKVSWQGCAEAGLC